MCRIKGFSSMEVLHPRKTVSPNFKGYKIFVPKAGEKAQGLYQLKKPVFSGWDTMSFLTALTTVAGFGIGGATLIGDHFYDLKHGKNKKEKKLGTEVVENKNASKAFENVGDSCQKQVYYVDKKNCKDKDEGARTITPSTKTAKMGLSIAKIGIAFSGIAGIFNGISMGLPLMAVGEALNLGASPIVETPLGTGLFSIALAAIFSGRALEHDPQLKMDMSKLSGMKSFKEKAGYVLKNMGDCTKEVWGTAKLFGQKIGHLCLKETRPEAVSFFKNNVFTIKPKALAIQESINSEGLMRTKITFKNNPYLMHAASFVLAIGGLTLALSSIAKFKKGEKVGLKTSEVGGGIDNLSLSRSGWEKMAKGGSTSTKLAGGLLGASGLTILAGQPGADTKWGRGTMWIGTALLFAVFAVERRANAFKKIVSKNELTSLVRQTYIDLTKLHPDGELGQKVTGSRFKTRLSSIIDFVKDEEKPKDPGFFKKLFNKNAKAKEPEKKEALEGETIKHLQNFVDDEINNKLYKGDDFNIKAAFKTYAKNNNVKISDETIEKAFSVDSRVGNAKELTNELKAQSDELFEKA